MCAGWVDGVKVLGVAVSVVRAVVVGRVLGSG
jgi:hypothetical protein